MPTHDDSYRTEKDSLGEIPVPRQALWGAQTQRAVKNFTISPLRLPAAFLSALALVKRACATTNSDLGQLDPGMAGAIAQAAGEIERVTSTTISRLTSCRPVREPAPT